MKKFTVAVIVAGFLLSSAVVRAADGNRFAQHNLVSDLPGVADHQDPNVVNPWGIAAPPTGPFWTSNNGTGTSTLFNGAGQAFPVGSPLVVTIPPPEGGTPPAAPTGVVFNPTTAFQVGANAPALFIFATEDGTISGWSRNVNLTNAILKATKANAVYKGIALGQFNGQPMLYATNFHDGTVDVYDTNFTETTVPGGFMDSDIPMGYAPFGIHAFGDILLVTYALQDAAKHDDVAGQGHGFIDVFGMDGRLRRRLVSHGQLNSPWGMTVAPAGFGRFGGMLLVGNFGDGHIHAYDMEGEFRGTLRRPDHKPVTVLGLWGLMFGNGVLSDANALFFTAGSPGTGAVEDHGLFGSLTFAPGN